MRKLDNFCLCWDKFGLSMGRRGRFKSGKIVIKKLKFIKDDKGIFNNLSWEIKSKTQKR